MESVLPNIPKMLEELMRQSDKLIKEAARAPPREKEWFALIKETAQRIADDELPEQSGSMGKASNGFSEFSTSIPDCLTFIRGKTEKFGTRVSSYFPQKERDHLHRKETNTSNVKNRSSVRVNADVSQTTPKRVSVKGKKSSLQIVKTDSDCVIIEEAKPASGLDPSMDRTFVKYNTHENCVTPVQNTMVPPLSSVKGKRKCGSAGRKLLKALPLEQEMFQKMLKTMPAKSHEPHLVTRSSRFSMGKKKFSGLRETHQPSVSRCSSKTSVKVKMEAVQCKEDAVAENLKKLKDARRKKIEESKKIRDEKMERTKEKRMKIEKARTLSAQQKTTETTKRSTRAQEKSMDPRSRSIEHKENSDPVKATSKKTTKSKSEKQIPLVSSKTPKLKKTPATSKRKKSPPVSRSEASSKSTESSPPQKSPVSSRASSKSTVSSPPQKTPMPITRSSSKSIESSSPLKTPVAKTTLASVKGRRPTPPLKTQLLKLTSPIASLQNTTVVINKETEVKSASKREASFTSPAAKRISKLQEGTASASGQQLNESSSPPVAKKTKLEQTPKAKPAIKKPDSYELTPDRSFTSYDMSEIVSDDEEETSGPQKRIPNWAMGLCLRSALLHQYHHPVDTDELFGNVWEAPNLEEMFQTKKKSYYKRTSSAVWQSPRAFR